MPTIAGFLSFLREIAGIPATVLPDDATSIPFAYNYALNIVSERLLICTAMPGQPSLYEIALYNLATHFIVCFAQDQPGAVFTGYIAGNNLSVVSVSSGVLSAKQILVGNGILPATNIIGGSALAWEVNPEQNYGSVSTPFTITSVFGYFTGLREIWKINKFVGGVVQTSSDESSSTTLNTSEVMARLTFANLNYLKTPYGQNYLNIANDVGQEFGIS